MKRALSLGCLVGLVWLSLASQTWAAYGKRPSKPSAFSPAGVSNTFKSIGSGTTKLVQGAVDLVTLKSLREKKTSKRRPVNQPWMNRPSTRRNKEEKKSFWSSLLPAKEEPKQVRTMKDFVGLKRPQ